MKLRTFSYIDILQPQTTAFLQTVSPGYMPVEGQASLFVEIAPGIAINQLTDIALKKTQARPGMLIVERAFGLLELHHEDQGQVRQAGEAILDELKLSIDDRIAPVIMSSQLITGIEGYQAQLINRMRHGNMLTENECLYTLEVKPAGYAAIATNEAEKAAKINVLEFVSFGAFGRVWLGGDEANVKAAAEAAETALKEITGI